MKQGEDLIYVSSRFDNCFIRRDKTVKRVTKAVSAVVLVLSLAGCASTSMGSQSTVEPANPILTTYSQEMINAHHCTEIYRCVLGNVAVAEPCTALEFEFDVLNPETSEVLVKGAKSYWGSVGVGLTDVEWGVNNAVSKAMTYSVPEVKCLTEKPDDLVARAVYDFPDGYCEGLGIGACTSFAMTGWEIDQYNAGTTTDPWGAGSGDGYTVVCNDGWVSQAGGKQGACSHHGGVSG